MSMFVLLAMLVLQTQAPSPSKEPVLNEVGKLKLQNVSQRIELAQLKFQAAQREYEAARGDLLKLLDELKVDGYTLKLETLSYQKDPVKK